MKSRFKSKQLKKTHRTLSELDFIDLWPCHWFEALCTPPVYTLSWPSAQNLKTLPETNFHLKIGVHRTNRNKPLLHDSINFVLGPKIWHLFWVRECIFCLLESSGNFCGDGTGMLANVKSIRLKRTLLCTVFNYQNKGCAIRPHG